jgi:HlyD family type I secretion membrane fusion protein
MVATSLAFLAWAAIAPLSGAVVTVGLVKTESNRKAVQHPEGGIVKAVLVRDGDRVRAGQALIELENVGTDSSFQLLRELVVFETLKRARLDAEQQLAGAFELDGSLARTYGAELVNAAFQRERRIFDARRTSLDQQLATLMEQLKAIEHERVALRGEVEADRRGIQLVQEELAINQALIKDQFVSRSRLLTLERGLADYQSRLGEHEGDLAQTQQRENDVKLRMASVRNEYQRAAAEEYKESAARLVELRERLRPAEDAVRRKMIGSPASGQVVGLRVHAAGEVAGPRDVLLEIVPDREDLVIEAQASVDGIREMRVGQPADIRFTAYKSRTTPVATGRVTYVAADAFADRNGQPFYVVRVRPDADSLKRAGITGLQPGMAAEVYILTEGRTVVDYLLSPITDTLRRAMREQ